MHVPGGIPKIDDYHESLHSAGFRRMEAFSDAFVRKHNTIFKAYSRKWISDPLHQWSRQWEYPFVYQCIAKHVPGHPVRVLDAGSGITFFPFYLQEELSNAEIICCDNDPFLVKIFPAAGQACPRPIAIYLEDLRRLSFADNYFDIVYCISVLEHTKDYPAIVEEFKRVLRPGGIFVVTFDISVDGCADIPPAKAQELLKSIGSHFSELKEEVSDKSSLEQAVQRRDILTTHYIKGFQKELLPWKYPLLSMARSAIQNRCFPRSLMKNLTIYCGAYRKG